MQRLARAHQRTDSLPLQFSVSLPQLNAKAGPWIIRYEVLHIGNANNNRVTLNTIAKHGK